MDWQPLQAFRKLTACEKTTAPHDPEQWLQKMDGWMRLCRWKGRVTLENGILPALWHHWHLIFVFKSGKKVVPSHPLWLCDLQDMNQSDVESLKMHLPHSKKKRTTISCIVAKIVCLWYYTKQNAVAYWLSSHVLLKYKFTPNLCNLHKPQGSCQPALIFSPELLTRQCV